MIDMDDNYCTTKVITSIVHDEFERVVASLRINKKKEFVILTPTKVVALVPFKAPSRSKFVIETSTAQGMTRSGRCYTSKSWLLEDRSSIKGKSR